MKPNPSIAYLNRYWAKTLIDALLAGGAGHFFVAPGSRSTPLALRVGELSHDLVTTHWDERGLAFAAMGFARGSGRPAVLLCTSGTAVANALPAVIEASLEHLPLIVLSADRPPELRDVGANQSIRQVGIFANFARWSFDLPCPTAEIDSNFVRTTASYACQEAAHGPIHLNCMFREPFHDDALSGMDGQISADKPTKPNDLSSSVISSGWCQVPSIPGGNTIVIAGSGPRKQTVAAREMAERMGAVFLSDVTSHIHERSLEVTMLADPLPPADCVIHVGGRLVSSAWYRWLRRSPPAHYVHFHRHADRIDSIHLAPRRYTLLSANMMESVHIANAPSPTFRNVWHDAMDITHRAVSDILTNHPRFSEPTVAYTLGNDLSDGHAIFLGNSLPIRDFDRFATWNPERDIAVGANRGASGIDGLIASAAGYALGTGRQTTLIMGDLSFLHDLNSLQLIRTCPVAVIVIVLNNQGGGIFRMLPIARQDVELDRMFVMPHGMADFSAAARQFQLQYESVATSQALQGAHQRALTENQSCVIEVKVDESSDDVREQIRQAIESRWQRR